MDKLAELVNEWHAERERDGEWQAGYDEGYAKAREDVERLLDAKGTPAARLKAVRAWAEV